MSSRYHRPRRGFTLVGVLFWLTLVGIASGLGVSLIHKSMRVQSRSMRWWNQDASLRNVLERIERDVARAQSAEIPDHSEPVLILQFKDRKIRYYQDDEKVVRLCYLLDQQPERGELPADVTEEAGNAEIPYMSWNLPEGAIQLRWQLENTPGNAQLLWTVIAQDIQAETHDSPRPREYATSNRLGSGPTMEEQP